MTSHAQPRSVSVSHVTATPSGPARHSISATTKNLLNTNNTGIFLSNDDSFSSTADRSFSGSVKDSIDHSVQDSLQDSLEDSLEDGAQAPLDIVGALSTLNLDAELGETSPQKPAKNVHVHGNMPNAAENSTNASLAQDRGHAASVPPPSLVHGQVFTPTMPSTASFGSVSHTLNVAANTPTYAWGNSFLPFSAPPVAYPVADAAAAAEMAMGVRPFRLPEDFGNGTTLGTAGQQAPQSFGGAVDARLGFDALAQPPSDAFGPSHYAPFDGPEQNGTRGSAAGFKSSGGAGNGDSETPHFAGSNLWNAPLAMAPVVPAPISVSGPNSAVSGAARAHFGPYAQYGQYGGSPAGSHEQGGFGSSRVVSEAHSGPRRHHSGHFGPAGGANVHRKMHGARRRGDDGARYAHAQLEDFKGEILSLCKDQHGCRFLQRQLDAENISNNSDNSISQEVAASMIFNELHVKIVELMVDPFGNYLVQKLLERVSAAQRLVLVKTAAPEFVRIALDPHGTRALQKLVECIGSRDESSHVTAALADHVVALSRDLNGNHVVQRCLQRLSPSENQFIFDAAAAHCAQIATHRHGCCVLQRCLDHGDASQRQQLSTRVAEISADLSVDPFGNYVVQYVLTRGDAHSVAAIVACIQAHVVTLSLHKFGSNVIEKTLRIPRLADAVIAVLLQNQKQFSMLLNDPYGNYVLQTSLDVASARDLARLAAGLQPFLGSIKNTPHGRRILTKIQNIL